MLLEPSFLHVTELQGDETNYSPFSSIEDTGQFFLEKRRARVQRTRGRLLILGSQLARKVLPSRSTSTNTVEWTWASLSTSIAVPGPFFYHRSLPLSTVAFCAVEKSSPSRKARFVIFFLPIKSYHNDRRALTLRYFSIRLRRHAATTSQRND